MVNRYTYVRVYYISLCPARRIHRLFQINNYNSSLRDCAQAYDLHTIFCCLIIKQLIIVYFLSANCTNILYKSNYF